MNIYVLNSSGSPIGMIETYQSVIWNVQYFSRNDFQLVTNASDDNLSLLEVGNLLVREIDKTNNTYQNVMLIAKKELSFDTEHGWILKVTGKGLKNILARRIVWSQLNLSGTVEDSIRTVITNNVINPSNNDRKIPNLQLDDKANLTDTAEIQLLGENIAQWLEDVCTQYGYGWDIYIDSGSFIFKLYKGVTRPVIFSPYFDNLYSSTYSYNLDNYANAALVGGEGDGINQKTATVGSGSGLDRYEQFIDGNNVSSNGEIITLETYTQMLQSYGNEQLASYQKTQTFEGEIEPNGVFKLNQDYFLGDVVTVENEKGISANPRIIEIIYSEDANGINVVPTFSEWEVI